VAYVLETPCLHGPSYSFPWLEKEKERLHVHEGQGGEKAPSGYLEDRGEIAEMQPWMVDLTGLNRHCKSNH